MDKKTKKKRKEISLMEIFGGQIVPEYAEEILEREVKKFGNSGHIPIPSKHIGKKARVIIKKKEDKKK